MLGDDSREPLYILTVPTVGYRFLCAVSAAEDGFGVSSESPRPGVSEVHENGLGDPAAVPSDLAPDLEEKPRGAPSKESAPSRPMIFIGLAVALLALVAGFLIRGAMKRKPVSGGNAISYPLVEQRVTSNPPDDPIEGAVISPDGKYVAYADPTGLYLRLMSTGETRPWILPKGFVARPNSWFPDSTHLLVVRIEGQTQGFDLDLWKPSLYKLSLLGGEPQKIMENAAAGCVSPDGARIAYLTRANVAKELWVMDSDGSNGRRVVSAGVLDKSGLYGSWLFPPVWSPGGQRLAYIEIHGINGSAPHEPSASVMTIDPNSGAPREAVNGSRVGQALWWANDGRILFAYHQDPSSKKIDDGVYSIRIDDRTGKAVGPPQPITQAEGFISGLSATADGKRLVLWRTREPLGAFIAKFDARTRQFGEPRRMTLDENENIASAWTADSRAILFASNRNGTWKLFKQGIDETTPEALTEAPIIGLSRLSPDGSQVLYLSSSTPDDDSVPAFLMGKPLAGGPPHLVRQVKGINNFGCARAPSKVCIFSKLVGQDHVFVSFDPNYDGGRELPIKMNGLMNWVISPDGSKLAIVLDRHRIRFFTVDTGVANDVTVKDWPIDNMDWSADGKTFFMPSVTPKDVPVILEVDQTGKARVVLQGFANTRIDWMIPSPDGKYGLLLEDTQAENNAWMVDNF